MLTAVGARDAVVLYILEHFFLGHTVGMCVGIKIINKIICSVAHFALLAVKKRIGEGRNMAACLPNSGVHQNIGVNLIAVFTLLNKAFAPCIFYIVFKPCAERAVVPCIGKTAVNIAAGEDKASALTKRYNFFHCFFCVVHNRQFIPLYILLLFSSFFFYAFKIIRNFL